MWILISEADPGGKTSAEVMETPINIDKNHQNIIFLLNAHK